MTEEVTVNVPLEKAAVRVKEFMNNKFPPSVEDVEIFRAGSDEPFFKAGTNEVVVSKIDENRVGITVEGPDLNRPEVIDAVTKGDIGQARVTSEQREGFIVFRVGGSEGILKGDHTVLERGDVVAEGLASIEEALRRLRQLSGITEDSLVTAKRSSPSGDITISKQNPKLVSESLFIGAAQSKGTIERALGIDSGKSRQEEVMGPVFKSFSHNEADYREPGDPDFDSTHPRCQDCAHFDDHGNCHIVPDIDSDGYCENFFADVGLFGNKQDIAPAPVIVNLAMFGELFDWDRSDIDEFIREAENMLEERVR